MVGRVRSIGILRTGDPALDRVQDHVKQQLDPVLQNTLLSAVDFRWIEVQGADPTAAPTFALQYRSATTQGGAPSWSTIGTFTSAGDLSTAISQDLLTAAGDIIYASAAKTAARLGKGTDGQLLSLGSGVPLWQGDTAWTAVSGGVGFQNAWVNFGGGNPAAAFFKDANGLIHVRGMVSTGAVGATIFTLPSGYRPAASFARFAVVSNNAFGYVSIDNSGNVALQVGSNVYAQLDTITFDTRA